MIDTLVRLVSIDKRFFHKGLSNLIYVINPQQIEEFNKNDFFNNFNFPFIMELEIILEDDPTEILDQFFHFVFHKNYYFIGHAPLIKISNTSNNFAIQKITSFFNNQGYKEVKIFNTGNDEPELFNIDNPNKITSNALLDSLPFERNEIQLLIGNTFVYCHNEEMFLKVESRLNQLLFENQELSLLNNKIRELIRENTNLKKQLAWNILQLQNHKMYLEVAIERLRQGTIGAIYMKLVNFINKTGPLRKLAKSIHGIIFKH